MTFSIAGICPTTGQIGFGVTTSSVAVGARVGAGIVGKAIVFSQARTDPRLHAFGIQAVARGGTAEEAVAAMVEAASGPQWRQVGVLLANGSAAAHTGESCTHHGGNVVGNGCLALGNAVQSPQVLEAMANGFAADPKRPLCNRLIDALCAGEEAGGEWTPLQSASLQVFSEHEFAYVDLRVDKSTSPLRDLGDLWKDFEPKAHSYLIRAIDPANSPPADEIEASADPDA